MSDPKADPKADAEAESHAGVAARNPTYVRTYERTEMVESDDSLETAVDADARIEEFTTVGDVIAAGELWQTNQRHPVIRSGEREPISTHVRAAVWYRDRGECAHCRFGKLPEHIAGILNLDHIQPWSAGGADETSNLRLLCEYHNKRRSNFVDFERPKMPATWWCLRCYGVDQPAWSYAGGWFVECPTHRRRLDGVSYCRVERSYRRLFDQGDVSNWHQRDGLEGGDSIAYCAHCDAPGLTSVVL